MFNKEKVLTKVGDLQVQASGADFEVEPRFRVGNNSVDEHSRVWIGSLREGVWSERCKYCVGALILSADRTVAAKLHHNPNHIYRRSELSHRVEELRPYVSSLREGRAIVWYREDEGEVAHPTVAWTTALIGLFAEFAITGTQLVFDREDWLLSAYYDGENTLKLVTSLQHKQKLFEPRIESI